jgi:predicted ATP-dependent endonuclease of OLD family
MEEPEAHLCINNIRLMISFIKAFTSQSPFLQLFFSTHNTEFVNKLDIKTIVIVNSGNAYSFSTELDDEGRDYLTKNPNLDLFKLFFSKRCILVEGLTEELIIRAYIDSKKELNDIEVIAFHKGFSKIMEIWLKVNQRTKNRLGIIRDFDNQANAQAEHDKYNQYTNICVRTTIHYTLEPEIVNTGDNYSIVKNKYGATYNWTGLNRDELATSWRNAKSSVMLQICKDMACGELPEFQMPSHIQQVLDFLNG